MRDSLLGFCCFASFTFAGVGCQVGVGRGTASGAVFILGCSGNGDYCAGEDCGSPDHLVPFDLRPAFFAGEPIDDSNIHTKGTAAITNRIILRLQRSGIQLDRNDVLTFDIVNSYEVARCVRGRRTVAADGSLLPDWDVENCDRASDQGPARVRLHYDGIARASFTPWASCSPWATSSPGVVAHATAPRSLSSVGDGGVSSSGAWDSWVELVNFGGAAEPAVADPAARKPVDPRFHISIGDRIQAARFRMTLVDDRVLTAEKDRMPIPQPVIGGYLEGNFDFNLARGQGAQTFP